MGSQVNKFELVHVWSHGAPPVERQNDRQTDSTENITFPHCVTGGKDLLLFCTHYTDSVYQTGEEELESQCGFLIEKT